MKTLAQQGKAPRQVRDEGWRMEATNPSEKICFMNIFRSLREGKKVLCCIIETDNLSLSSISHSVNDEETL